MLEIEKLKRKKINIKAILTELDSKYTSLSKQDEWSNLITTSNIDSNLPISTSTDLSSEVMQLLSGNIDFISALITNLK